MAEIVLVVRGILSLQVQSKVLGVGLCWVFLFWWFGVFFFSFGFFLFFGGFFSKNKACFQAECFHMHSSSIKTRPGLSSPFSRAQQCRKSIAALV